MHLLARRRKADQVEVEPAEQDVRLGRLQGDHVEGTAVVRNGLIRGRNVSFELVLGGKPTRLQGEAPDAGSLVGKGWRADR